MRDDAVGVAPGWAGKAPPAGRRSGRRCSRRKPPPARGWATARPATSGSRVEAVEFGRGRGSGVLSTLGGSRHSRQRSATASAERTTPRCGRGGQATGRQLRRRRRTAIGAVWLVLPHTPWITTTRIVPEDGALRVPVVRAAAAPAGSRRTASLGAPPRLQPQEGHPMPGTCVQQKFLYPATAHTTPQRSGGDPAPRPAAQRWCASSSVQENLGQVDVRGFEIIHQLDRDQPAATQPSVVG